MKKEEFFENVENFQAKLNGSDLDNSTTYSSSITEYEKMRNKNIEKKKKFLQDLKYKETQKEVKINLKQKRNEIKTIQKIREPKTNKKRKKSSKEVYEELQKKEEQKEGIFGGLYFLFFGVDLRQKRSQILKEKVEENGKTNFLKKLTKERRNCL